MKVLFESIDEPICGNYLKNRNKEVWWDFDMRASRFIGLEKVPKGTENYPDSQKLATPPLIIIASVYEPRQILIIL